MKDARLDELHFLGRLERDGSILVSGADLNAPDVRIAMHLLAHDIVNDASTESFSSRQYETIESRNYYREHVAQRQWRAINDLHHGDNVVIRRTHASNTRRADLEQSIQRDRLRDKWGILFDARYSTRDLQMAIWGASREEPLSVAFLDMNGLKQLNDTHGHDAGDEAIRAFCDVVAAAVAERGDAYLIGGDEIVIVFPRMRLELSEKLLVSIVQGVSAHAIRGQAISAAAGLTVTTDPTESAKAVRERADALQYQAKERSKSGSPRFGALALDGCPIQEFHT